MSEPLTSKDLVVGGFYNWKGQPERLSYIGAQRYNGESRTWHQFALVDVPGDCWCEVLDWQLNLFEVTERAAVQAAQPEAVADEHLLRLMLAIRVAGPTLYADDGELQDNSVQPFIDFKRDSAKEIERKLMERGMANAWKSIGQFAAAPTTEAVGEPICERCNGSGETTVLSSGGPDAYDVAINCPACRGTGASCAMTDAAGEAFNNTFHKVRAEVSMDLWQRIWAKAVEWERSRASAPTPEPMSAPTAVEPDERAERDAFQAWANREGYDTAYNYDTERSRWVFFNPMTADLWKAWRASKGTPL